jgi:DnaJ-domain-containing protein 1
MVLGARISEQASSSNSESSRPGDDTPGSSSAAKAQSEGPRSWPDVLGVPPDASREAIREARDKLVWGFHPDRLKSVDGINPELERYANEKLVEINLAYEQAVTALKA